MSEINKNKPAAQMAPEWFEELGKLPHYVLPDLSTYEPLHSRARQAAILMAQGYQDSEAAARMGIKDNTLRDYLKTIHEAWQIGIGRNLLSPPWLWAW